MELIVSVSRWNGMFLSIQRLHGKATNRAVSWGLVDPNHQRYVRGAVEDLVALALDQFQGGNCTLSSLDWITYCIINSYNPAKAIMIHCFNVCLPL